MELIRKLGTIKDKNGNYQSWDLFKCPDSYCGKEVERLLHNGRKANSCGCNQYSQERNQLISKNKKGKKRKPFTEEHRKSMSTSHAGKSLSEEHRQKLKENHTRGENHPMYDVHRFGEEAPNWQGGISFEEYPPEFNKELKQIILERDNYTCQCPDCEEKSVILQVHHIDYNKYNNNPDNLITLCNSCHTKTNGKNRIYFTEFYQNIIVSKVMECFL